MTATERSPIWLNPPKFWAATRDMAPKQVEELMDELMVLAEVRDIEALKRFDFILIRNFPKHAA